MEDNDRRARLGRFLRSCRERTKFSEDGQDGNGRRRTPGLRREEVAARANISPAYYTKIEQGRVDVSAPVLNTLAGLFKLSHTERAYAFALATDYLSADGARSPEEMNPVLDLLLTSLNPYPAQIIGYRWDLLGWNEASSAVLGDLAAVPAEARNLLVMMFLAPPMREMIEDWESNALRMLAEFRADYGRYHYDPAFAELVTFLCNSSPQFETWWSELRDIGGVGNSPKIINHPLGGQLHLQETVLDIHDHPGLRLIVFLPQDEANRHKLEQITSDYTAMQRQETTAL
jgi:transcriptional regulator with XRE-family HTH domain